MSLIKPYNIFKKEESKVRSKLNKNSEVKSRLGKNSDIKD
jgi:hypothetical protein